MIELTPNIGDDRRCSITVWKAVDWQALATTSGLPQPSRIQDHMVAGKVSGQTHYFLIGELPRMVGWLETTGRTYRLRNYNEVTPLSAEMVKARAIRQEQTERAAEAAIQRAALKSAAAIERAGSELNNKIEAT